MSRVLFQTNMMVQNLKYFLGHEMQLKNESFEIETKDRSLDDICTAIDSCDKNIRLYVLVYDSNIDLVKSLTSKYKSIRKICFAFVVCRNLLKIDFSIFKEILNDENFFLLPSDFDFKNEQTVSCVEINDFIVKLRQLQFNAQALPYRDYKIFPEAEGQVEMQWQLELADKPTLSVIIPTRNNSLFLVNTIQHLFSQTLSFAAYEVIVVDDGGHDHTRDKLKALLGPIHSQIQFKYLYRHRLLENEQNFNAGLCRNAGLKIARGEWVLFLDSDMLVEKNFLEDLMTQTLHADMIQCPRLHIRPEKSTQNVRPEDLPSEDLYIEEPSYWTPFFDSADWNKIPHHWRYTCTYCLAVRKSAIDQLGHFRPIFRSYGFEDTDLGYRFAKAKMRFLLWKEQTYHLTPNKKDSRYSHQIWRKQLLLQKTGKQFYLSNLDPEIFSLFPLYMHGEPRWLQKLYFFFKKVRTT
ncbi:MAG: glycosyltransferase family 2 protein [Bdellovibrio sp.]